MRIKLKIFFSIARNSNFTRMFDPRQVLVNPFVYNIDPAAIAMLSSAPAQNHGGGKIGLNNSFRISDILESSDEKANTSEEHGKPKLFCFCGTAALLPLLFAVYVSK